MEVASPVTLICARSVWRRAAWDPFQDTRQGDWVRARLHDMGRFIPAHAQRLSRRVRIAWRSSATTVSTWVGLGKQVERLHHSDAIAEGLQFDRSRPACGIARHVDDSCGPARANSPHDLSPSAARGDRAHHRGAPCSASTLGQDTAGVTGKKAGVVQAIAVALARAASTELADNSIAPTALAPAEASARVNMPTPQ